MESGFQFDSAKHRSTVHLLTLTLPTRLINASGEPSRISASGTEVAEARFLLQGGHEQMQIVGEWLVAVQFNFIASPS
jgi:hypothetical protein